MLTSVKVQYLANEWEVRLGWATDQSEDSLANERVLKLGWALDQSEDVLSNEIVVREGLKKSNNKLGNFPYHRKVPPPLELGNKYFFYLTYGL